MTSFAIDFASPRNPQGTYPASGAGQSRRPRFARRSLSAQRIVLITSAAASIFAWDSTASASNDIQLLVFEKQSQFLQTTAQAPPEGPTTWGFQFGVAATAGVFASGSVSCPGPLSPLPLTLEAETSPNPATDDLHYGAMNYPTQAAMDAALPFGTYNVTCTNSSDTVTEQASLAYTKDLYPDSVASFTPGCWEGLQNFNGASPFQFQWSPFSDGSTSSFSSVLILVAHQASPTSLVVDFNSGYLPYADTSTSMPADTLSPGVDYVAIVEFSNEINSAAGVSPDTTQFFQTYTQASFSISPVPEPASAAAVVAAGMFLSLRRKDRNSRRIGVHSSSRAAAWHGDER